MCIKKIGTWNTCCDPSPVAAQNSPGWCMQLQRISLLHSCSPGSTAVVPCTSRGFVPWWAHPWSPSQALSPPVGVLYNESVLWIRSASANPSAVFSYSYVCVQGRCDSTRHAFWFCLTCVCLPVCESLHNIWLWGSVDPEGWKPVTEGIPPVTLTVIVSVCLNGCVRLWCGESSP